MCGQPEFGSNYPNLAEALVRDERISLTAPQRAGWILANYFPLFRKFSYMLYYHITASVLLADGFRPAVQIQNLW